MANIWLWYRIGKQALRVQPKVLIGLVTVVFSGRIILEYCNLMFRNAEQGKIHFWRSKA